MDDLSDKTRLCARVEAHASLLETAAALMELDGVGLAPDQGHVHHLRRMAGALRAEAAIGRLPQSYSGGAYLPDPSRARTEPVGIGCGISLDVEAIDQAWH